jgi:hypothetical protein
MIKKLLCRIFKLISLKELTLIKEQYENTISGLNEEICKLNSEVSNLKATVSALQDKLSNCDEKEKHLETKDAKTVSESNVRHSVTKTGTTTTTTTTTKTKRKRIAANPQDASPTITSKPNETKNLKLTESFNIDSINKNNTSSAEVINSFCTTDPQITSIINKLAKINLKVTYKNGGFYYQRKDQGEEERLPFIRFEEYNKQILLLCDGKNYCGYDMGTGKKASKIHKKRIETLVELDSYYEENYCK